MIEKKDVKCIKKTTCGPFYDNFIIFIKNKFVKTNIFDLRIMNKSIIIKYEEEKLIQYEYYIRIRLRHPFLVNVLFSFQDYDNLFLIMEFANTNFQEFLKIRGTFTKKAAKFYICEIILVIEYLHSRNQTYGFFVSKNIFVNDKGHIKLKYEFLNAIIEKRGGVRDFIDYTAPEYILNGKITQSTDIWQIGILLFHMLVGYTPFNNESYDLTKRAILNQDFSFPEFVDVNSRDLIRKILEKDSTKRINFSEMKKHPFFGDVDWDAVHKQTLEPPFLFDELSKYKNASPADLDKIYTSDYYNEQNKDGYGKAFRYFGRIDADNPFIKKN
ncbi:cAMP-dependent protein kinase catalytic subunit [Vairimorpha necatrix]|uniref:cAMP-dependent protein kinase catalytic subunit n=1 Tax=Vairimorpha necatrix TaxID=6039 RepID=A0AAX4JDW2_9MICR